MRRRATDARLEHLEESARQRAASRREQRKRATAVESPEYREWQFQQSLRVAKLMIELDLLQLPPDRCPRPDPAVPVCSACLRWQKFATDPLGEKAAPDDDEACAHMRLIAELLPFIPSGPVPEPPPQYLAEPK
jgi:hypothetical protein